MSRTETVPVASLILDYTLYARQAVDVVHVADLGEALRYGAQLPPVLVDRASRRVVDGFHRVLAHKRVGGDEARLPIVWGTYPSEKALFEAAMTANSAHGQKMRHIDQAHSIIKAAELGLSSEQTATALHLTVERVERLQLTAMGLGPDARPVPLKPAFRHLAGQTLTNGQIRGNRLASGLGIVAAIRQVINLLERDGIPEGYELAWAELRRLVRLVGEKAPKEAEAII